ncbi:MAG: radical SAM protein [bacterium]
MQDACDSFCSYCIVPFARGPLRSRSLQTILFQARRLVESGHREIILPGVRLGAYGVDLSETISLGDVLKALIEPDGLWRIRLSSVEPMECSPQIIDLIASSQKICRHLHIPLQSGDDEILRRMRRNYSAREFARSIPVIHSQKPLYP